MIERLNDSPSLVLIFPLFIAFPVALLATFGAAVKAGRAPKWVLGAAAAALALAIAHPISDRFSTSAALLCLITAAVGVATRGERTSRITGVNPLPAAS